MVEQSTNNLLENVYKFNAKELDAQTGYYYYGARYYDPGASIFLSVDPLAEQFPGWTPYHYVHNNPINLVDPTGMSAQEPQEPEKGNVTSWFTRKSDIQNSFMQGDNTVLNEIVINIGGESTPDFSMSDSNGTSDNTLSNAVTAGQLFGGTITGIMGDMSQKYMDKSSYLIGTSNYSNSIDFNGQLNGNVGINFYSKGYKESMNSMKNLNSGLNFASRTLNYAGYIDGGLMISQGKYASGAHSMGNNYLGAQIGTTFGWGYGLLYSASYTTFENTLPKSEWYNRMVFGVNSPTYNARRYYWTKSKLEP